MYSKYMKWYDQLILRGKLRKTKDGYYEKHHIVPKAFGGTNCSTNLVKLTAREHYVAHLLLYFNARKYGTEKELSSTAYALLYFVSASRNARTPSRLKILPGFARVYDSVRTSISKLRTGKSLVELVGDKGYENYLAAHKARRKYTDIFTWTNGEHVISCTPYELAEKYDIPISGLIKVAYKDVKISKGWYIQGSDISTSLKLYSKPVTLYNIYTEEVVSGPFKEVSNITGVPTSRMSRTLAGSQCGAWCGLTRYTKLRAKYLKASKVYVFEHINGTEKICTLQEMCKFLDSDNIRVIAHANSTTRRAKNWRIKDYNYEG